MLNITNNQNQPMTIDALGRHLIKTDKQLLHLQCQLDFLEAAVLNRLGKLEAKCK